MNWFKNLYTNICDFFGYIPNVKFERLNVKDRTVYWRAWHVTSNTFGFGKTKHDAFNEMSYNLNTRKLNKLASKSFHGWS